MTTTCNDWTMTWTSAAQAIYALLPYTDKKERYTLTDVMGVSGHAFRINIHPADVNAAGPTMFDPEQLLEDGLHLLGFSTEPLHGFSTPATPEQLREAIEFAQASIDRGLPVIGWSLFVPEFGLIYGYDDEKQELYCRDPRQDGALPYAKLNELPMKFVYMLRVTDSQDVDPLEAWTKGLRSIIEFARGQAPTLSAEYKHGLAGYDAWMEAFRHRTVDPFGNAYNTAVVCCAREFGVRFLESFPERWTGDSEREEALRRLGAEAAKHYGAVAEALRGLQRLFPFPQGGEPNDPASASEAEALLKAAKAAEEQGGVALERMYEALTRECVS
ncbi:hypothetical protein QJQ58_28375 [Paenibacillus dendritiformis]|uniref:hypothetical protein n=1 Tax=Paenibacillus dendritiformis TaxID=130049 RepID=UPI00248C4F13|nr:hypothetical protein [Paenibacillus dendritiformis]WGU94360.1 hypothetical protein QJQ58_28375 [Paenibacillus dendritiformis]